MIGVAVVGMLAVAIVLWAILLYNGLVRKRNLVAEAWSGIDVQLKRRTDLIPNLVATVKGYATHEQSTLEEVVRLRNQAQSAQGVDETAQTQGLLSAALGRLFALVENYPDLKANQNFIALQDELAGTENRISVERQRYNETVQTYNTAVRQMPTALLARLAGFQPRAPFEAAPAAAEAPKVEF